MILTTFSYNSVYCICPNKSPCRVLKKWKRRVLIGDAKNRTLKELKEANKAAEIHLGNFPMKHSQVKKGYYS
jgi:hypothetical protein